MPVSIDARPPGVNLTFLRGTARNLPFAFPTGTLAGRTFTATLDGVNLSVVIVGDTLTVSVTVAQTNAAASGPLAFVLTETTGVDQPIVVGTWHASTRPQAVTRQTTITVTTNTETIQLQVISGTQFPELVAGDPTEVGLVTAAGTTTLSLLDKVARIAVHRAGQYYGNFTHSLSGTRTLTQDSLRLQRAFLSKGTVDRIGLEVTTAVASLTIRMGIYADDSGFPLGLIAEAASTADGSTTGTKDLTISAVIPKNGWYWLAVVSQGAAGGAVRDATNFATQLVPMPIGTTAPSGVGPYAARTQTGVTGALPSTIGTLVDPATSWSGFVHYRYSTVG